MVRRWPVVVLGLLSILALACEGAVTPTPSRRPQSGLPSSMAALGDSVTAGFLTCVPPPKRHGACPQYSWSTGTKIDSHYRRIRAGNPKMASPHNFARPGALASELDGQAEQAVKAKVQYVTVLIGANDACTSTVAEMTPADVFRDQVDQALATLKKGLPAVRILVVSLPDVYRLWQIGHTNSVAVFVWKQVRDCQSLLANPTSTAQADNLRRRAVADRVDAYDRQLAAACEAYGKHCRWDGGRAHAVRFSLNLVSVFDYFHPNREGQAQLAAVTYPNRFNW